MKILEQNEHAITIELEVFLSPHTPQVPIFYTSPIPTIFQNIQLNVENDNYTIALTYVNASTHVHQDALRPNYPTNHYVSPTIRESQIFNTGTGQNIIQIATYYTTDLEYATLMQFLRNNCLHQLPKPPPILPRQITNAIMELQI